MKRFLSALLAAALLCAMLAGCGEASPSGPVRPDSLPAYNPNPLTGLEKDAGYPYGQRPVAVMINNIKKSLPQSGTAGADMIYEMVTEGGITRLMAVYSDLAKASGYIGPVRSARDQHLQMILPINALYVHIGSSTFARDMLEIYHYADKDLDGNASTVRDVGFWLDEERHKERDIEHCWYTSAELVNASIKKYSLDATAEEIQPVFSFRDYNQPARSLAIKSAAPIHVQFSADYYSDFEYNASSGLYMKSEFGTPQIDAATGEQLGFSNLLILFTDITPRPDGVLMDVNYDFGGSGYYFSNGGYELIRWEKGNPEDPLRIVQEGNEDEDVEINCGKSYIAVVDITEFLKFTVGTTNPMDTGTLSAAASSEG